MGGKARATISNCDKFSFFCCIAGPLMITAMAVNTTSWWRLARPDMQLGWPERRYNVQGPSNNRMSYDRTWKMLKVEVCASYEMAQKQYGTPGGMMEFQMMSAMGAMTHIPLQEGMPCGFKPMCRSHMSLRCMWYWQIDMDRHILTTGQMVALGFSGLGQVIVLLSGNRDHRLYVTAFTTLGLIAGVGSWCWYIFDTDQFQHELGGSTGWPYARSEGAGFYASSGGATWICCGCIASCCGLGSAEEECSSDSDEAPLMMGGPPMM